MNLHEPVGFRNPQPNLRNFVGELTAIAQYIGASADGGLRNRQCPTQKMRNLDA
jgi:hypothetical protein